MSERTDNMKRRYQMFDQGDLQGATEEWADDIVWQGSNSTEIPGGGERNGKQAVLEALGEVVGAFDEFQVVPDEFFEEGDTVVVLAHTEARKGDQSIKSPIVHVFRWKGDEVKRFQALGDSLQMAEVLGIK